MRKFLFLLCLPSAAFSSTMHVAPEMAGVVYNTPNDAGDTSWYSFWIDSLATTKTSDLGIASQSAATQPKATSISSVSFSDDTPVAVDPPAAIAANPEPGTWGLLTLGFASGLLALYRHRAKQ